MTVAVVLFNGDLRTHDHPALTAAADGADRVVPLFVVDDEIVGGSFAGPNRTRFLVECLTDLRGSLRELGADLVVRHGDPVAVAVELAVSVGAQTVHASADVSDFARRREERLTEELASKEIELELHPGVMVLDPDALKTYKVFTPYWKQWIDVPRRPIASRPDELMLPDDVDVGEIPDVSELTDGPLSPDVVPGGETEARRRVDRWLDETVARYDDIHDDLPGDETSRLSPYLHFGCISPLELAERADEAGGGEFVRQLCWRDFHHQTAAAFPAIARRDYRERTAEWADDEESLEAWKEGRTGYPIVDAGMRQLLAEGWMHNRTRMITGAFLTKHLRIHWRHGASHFEQWLVDGDIANNSANWQWVAGTGNDTRPGRIFNPIRQAVRFDPDGDYVRRYVPELAGVDGKAVHEPWELGPLERESIDYPERIVDHEQAADEFRARMAGDDPDQP